MKLFFLKIDRVPSRSSYAHHADWIECYGFDEILKKRFPGGSSQGERRDSGPKEVSVHVLPENHSSQTLLQMSSTGRIIASAVLEKGLKNGDAKFTLEVRVRMTDVWVQSYQFGHDWTAASNFDSMELVCGTLAYEFGSARQLLP